MSRILKKFSGSLESTNHSSFPDREILIPDPAVAKIFHCRFCGYTDHIITSCTQFHTHGYGRVTDDDLSRESGCNVVYYFPHKPQQQYDASKLKNPPIREFKSKTAFRSLYNNVPDYLLDSKNFVIEDQEYHFNKQRKIIKNAKIKKIKVKKLPRLELRLCRDENGKSNEEMSGPSFKYDLASVVELKEELTELGYHGTKNINKNKLSILLSQLRSEKRQDGTFTEAKDTIANGIIRLTTMPTTPSDIGGGVDNVNVDSVYRRQLHTEVSNSDDSPRLTNQPTSNFLQIMLEKIPFYGELTITEKNLINERANPVGIITQFSAIGGNRVENTPTLIETPEPRVTPTLLTADFPITTQQQKIFQTYSEQTSHFSSPSPKDILVGEQSQRSASSKRKKNVQHDVNDVSYIISYSAYFVLFPTQNSKPCWTVIFKPTIYHIHPLVNY